MTSSLPLGSPRVSHGLTIHGNPVLNQNDLQEISRLAVDGMEERQVRILGSWDPGDRRSASPRSAIFEHPHGYGNLQMYMQKKIDMCIYIYICIYV